MSETIDELIKTSLAQHEAGHAVTALAHGWRVLSIDTHEGPNNNPNAADSKRKGQTAIDGGANESDHHVGALISRAGVIASMLAGEDYDPAHALASIECIEDEVGEDCSVLI